MAPSSGPGSDRQPTVPSQRSGWTGTKRASRAGHAPAPWSDSAGGREPVGTRPEGFLPGFLPRVLQEIELWPSWLPLFLALPNAGAHLLPKAEARNERRLEAARCSAWVGASAAAPPHMRKEQGQPARLVLSSWADRGSS